MMKNKISLACSLPHDLIEEILSRLPAKSLLRFRCVCKSWCNLIFYSDFVKKHHNRSIETGNFNLFLTTVYYSSYRFKEIYPDNYHLYPRTKNYHVELQDDSFGNDIKLKTPLDLPVEDLNVLGSCNGLVCFICCGKCMCLNPYTSEYKLLDFNRNFSFRHAYGFVYNPFDNDYKVVEFVNTICDGVVGCNVTVYSVADASSSTSFSIPYPYDNKEGGIHFNGALHWLVRTKNEPVKVFALDIMEKVVLVVPRPPDVDELADMAFGVLGGKLGILCMSDGRSEIQVWLMKNYGVRDSWSKLFSIDMSIFRSLSSLGLPVNGISKSCDLRNYRPLCFSRIGEIILKGDRDLIQFDPKTKTARKLEIRGLSDSCRLRRAVTHVESLVSLKSGTYLRNFI